MFMNKIPFSYLYSGKQNTQHVCGNCLLCSLFSLFFEVLHPCLASINYRESFVNILSCFFFRSYWVGDISWTHDSLFLACVLKRGSLVLLTCQGELLTLVTFGCSIEFGPAEFIPLHPLITYR